MANAPRPSSFFLSTQPPVNIQQIIVTEGENTHVLTHDSVGFHNVALDFTGEKWTLLSTEQTDMDKVVMSNQYENLSNVVLYFSQPIMIIKSEEVQDRMDIESPSGFSSNITTPFTFHQAQPTQNSLQLEILKIKEEPIDEHSPPQCNSTGEALCTEATIAQSRKMGEIKEESIDEHNPPQCNSIGEALCTEATTAQSRKMGEIKEEPIDEHSPPQCNSIGEALCTEATIAQSRKMDNGEQSHSHDHCKFDPGESSHGRPHNGVSNGQECSADTNPSGVSSFVAGQKRNQVSVKHYICKDCGKLFSFITQLPNTNPLPLTFSHCNSNSTLTGPTDLQLHLRKHTGNQQHKCDTCGKCFSSKYSLKRHFTIHSGEKPYECPECKKTFRILYLLQQHKVIHSERKRYECNECGKTFHWRSNLKRHMLTHPTGK